MNENINCFFEKINKTYEPLARPEKKKKRENIKYC